MVDERQPVARSLRFLMTALLALGSTASWSYVVAPTTAVSAATFTYGMPTNTRADVDQRAGSTSQAVEARRASRTLGRSFIATNTASSATSGANLGRQLASEPQVGEAGTSMAGANSVPFKPLCAADGLAETYGENETDWSKMG